MNTTKLKAPFGWVGGKSKLAKDIVSLFPQHTTYVEVFGGALSVLYSKEKSRLEIINDINSELINLHKAIRNNPQSLQMYFNQLLISRELFSDIKNNRLKPRNDIERAAFYFYIITQYDSSETLFYLDPPYVSTEHYYKRTGGFGVAEHKKLVDLLKMVEGKFLLSYNDCDLVRELYKNFYIFNSKEIKYSLNIKANKRVREVFISNV